MVRASLAAAGAALLGAAGVGAVAPTRQAAVLSAQAASSPQAPADFFVLVQQWGESQCDQKGKSCAQPPSADHFTIHGLWANYNDGSYPSFCNSSYPFEESQVASIEDELDEYWPSFGGADTDFWKHEWEKHGTCAGPFIEGELAFFKETLQMAEQSDLLNALLAAGIKPSDSDEYSPEDIVEALADGLGVTPAIHCSGATGIGTQLSEVWICVDTDLAFMECPSIVKTTCTGDIAIPPVPSRVAAT